MKITNLDYCKYNPEQTISGAGMAFDEIEKRLEDQQNRIFGLSQARSEGTAMGAIAEFSTVTVGAFIATNGGVSVGSGASASSSASSAPGT